MSILPAQEIRKLKPVEPFEERTKHNGQTYGLGPAGYDIRVAEDLTIWPGGFMLASSMERFSMPNHVLGIVHDKSTWARRGIAVQNTVIEPGWRGFLTLELTNHSRSVVIMSRGDPIAQIIFHALTAPTELSYSGKYQDQAAGPQPARYEAMEDESR